MTWAAANTGFSWRPSQRTLLAACDDVRDERWHLCAPPGSGKTLIGLELARRLGRRTLVLSPTTAIRDQWASSVSMFGLDPVRDAGTELGDGATLTSVTYQLVGNPGSAAGELRAAARRMWVDELGAGDRHAAERIDTLEEHDPSQYRRELNTWVRRLRRTLSSEDAPLPAQHLLGDRTSALIDQVVALGYGTVVLDECHHLLDWWALVLAELIERMRAAGPVAVIGLTATLPDPDGAREAENYLRLLGDVDVVIPMAALVADGELAPWRDGAWFVTPTDAELAFLDDEHRHLVDDLDAHLRSDEFVEWAVGTVLRPALDARGSPSGTEWQGLWDRDPFTAQALTSWWSHRGMALPVGAPSLAPEVQYDAEARLLLLWRFVHDRHCPDGVREPLTKVLARHGMAFTTGGVRRTRTVSDIVAARSVAKAVGAAEIVEREARRRDDRLCALVVLEQDRADTPAAVRAAFPTEIGTALRATSALCGNPTVVGLGVLAVTGRGMWIDALHADDAAALLNVDPDVTRHGDRWVGVTGTEVDRVVELDEQGPAWTSATRLDAARRLLDAGVVHTLVATRALVGEGWNHPPLNVLVDLSEAASPAAVTQLRGRAVRLDPADGGKIASLWDVVVAHDAATGEWARARRKHLHWWGPDHAGAIVTGAAKASPLLDRSEPPHAVHVTEANDLADAAVADRDATRAAWRSVPSNASAVPELVVRPRSRRTVTARLPIARPMRRLVVGGSAAVGWTATAVAGTVLGGPFAPVVAGATLVGAIGFAIVERASRRSRATVRTDDPRFWTALGLGVRDGLDAVGVTQLGDASVTAVPVADGHRIVIDAGGADASAWCAALTEMLGPVGTPRWLLHHDPDRSGVEAMAWRVPAAVGARRADAEAFHVAFAATVPATELLRGGTPEATAATFGVPVHQPDVVEQAEHWR